MSEEHEIVNAEITEARLGFERGTFLTAHIAVTYGEGGVQGFGGWVLGADPFNERARANKHHEQPNLAAEYITRLLRVADVDSFDQLVGRIVRVRRGPGWNGLIQAIGHPYKDRWLCPDELAMFGGKGS